LTEGEYQVGNKIILSPSSHSCLLYPFSKNRWSSQSWHLQRTSNVSASRRQMGPDRIMNSLLNFTARIMPCLAPFLSVKANISDLGDTYRPIRSSSKTQRLDIQYDSGQDT